VELVLDLGVLEEAHSAQVVGFGSAAVADTSAVVPFVDADWNRQAVWAKTGTWVAKTRIKGEFDGRMPNAAIRRFTVASGAFPVEPAIRIYPRVLAGTRRASPVACHVLATMLSLSPLNVPHRSDFGVRVGFPFRLWALSWISTDEERVLLPLSPDGSVMPRDWPSIRRAPFRSFKCLMEDCPSHCVGERAPDSWPMFV
jgi:hypothetical protein